MWIWIRRLWKTVTVVLALIGLTGVPNQLADARAWLDWLNASLPDPAYPGIFVIGLFLLLVPWLIPDTLKWVMGKFVYSRAKEEFSLDFDGTADSRMALRERLDEFYTSWDLASKPRLTDLIDNASFLKDLPVEEVLSLREWGETVPTRFVGESRELWDFAISVCGRIRKERRSASKFWNRWGSVVYECGECRLSDIEDRAKGNLRDMKVLCYLEAAEAVVSGWDDSSGKRWLFRLTREAADKW